MDHSSRPGETGQPYVNPQVVPEAPARMPGPPPPRRSSALAKIFIVFLVFGLGLSLLLNFGLMASLPSGLLESDPTIEERHHSLARNGQNKIAVINITGAILDGEGYLRKQIDRARDDERVKAVIVRVNSPGGTVTASDYLYHHLSQLRDDRELPIVVSMGGIAASGGYYISMCVGDTPDTIFAEPTTWTGSIGVIIPHYDLSGLLAKYEVADDSVKSHPLKGIGSITKKMTDEERAVLQALVDDSFDQFKDVVRSGRPELRDNDELLDQVATGQVFSTNQALEHGLVDQEGFIEDAIEKALELAMLDEENTSVVEYRRPLGLFNLFAGAQTRSTQTDLAALLDLSTPRAYYLCSWLPQLSELAQP